MTKEEKLHGFKRMVSAEKLISKAHYRSGYNKNGCPEIVACVTVSEIKALAEAKNSKRIKFILNGCDISFIAEAPADITLEQLLKQCNKIKPDYCACGICTAKEYYYETEIIIDYNGIKKANEGVPCKITEE